MVLSAKEENKAGKGTGSVCVLLFWSVCWTSIICPSLLALCLVVDICEQHEGAFLPAGFLLGVADGKHLEETGGKNASEHSSAKSLRPYHEVFPVQPTQLQEHLSFLAMIIMTAFTTPGGLTAPSDFPVPSPHLC